MAEDRGACFPCSSLPYCPLCRFPGPGGWALPFSLFPTCTQRKAKYRGCEHVPSTGPWEQAEGLSEPSLLLDRCLEEERKAILLQHVPVHPCCPLARLGDGSVPTTHSVCSRTAAPLLGTSHTSHRDPLASPSMGKGTQQRAIGHIQSRVLPSHTAVPFPSSLPWYGA